MLSMKDCVTIQNCIDKLLQSLYDIAISNRKEEKMLLAAQENLKQEILAIENETILENLKCFVMGMKAQEELDRKRQRQGRTNNDTQEEV
jgi:hypothetical protein